MSATLRLVSLNVQHEMHLDTVSDFLAASDADVVCLQELREDDVARFSESFRAIAHAYVPMTKVNLAQGDYREGLGIISRMPLRSEQSLYYVGTPDVLPTSDPRDIPTFNNLNRIIFAADVEKDGDTFRIATTHGTWTPDGKPTDMQRADITSLLSVLPKLGEFVLCGDFNAPRDIDGEVGEMFAQIAARYKDNIPLEYTSSLDPKLHRAGHLQRMVDGMFSAPGYTVSDVELRTGISDHCAVLATIAKA